MRRMPSVRMLPFSLVLGVSLALMMPDARAQAPAQPPAKAPAQPQAQAPAATPAPSLYKRLGGYDAIAAVTDDFVPRLLTDPQLSRFFVGHGMDTKMRIRQHVVDLVCMATGGPCLYIGRDMKTAHGGLGITETDWTTASNHLVASLDKFKVGQKEKDEFLAIVNGLKKDIVEAPAASK